MHPYRRPSSIASSRSTRASNPSRRSRATKTTESVATKIYSSPLLQPRPASRPGTNSTTRQRPATGASRIGGLQNFVCALTESRGVSATIGLCFVNFSTSKISQALFRRTLINTDKDECVLSEICDSQQYVRTLQKLHVYDPTEVMRPYIGMSTSSTY